MLWLILGIFLLVIIICYLLSYVENYWKDKNITYSKTWPFLGEFKDVILRRKNIGDVLLICYNKFPGKRYYGTYAFNRPCLVIKDVDLIKKITVKDFDYFTDRIQVNRTDDPVFTKTLVALQGEKWRKMRNTLSPSFTGNKIRIMFHLITDCASQLNEYFLNKNEEIIEVEMKDIMSRTATDVIATTAFGIRCNSLKENNEFYQTGRLLLQANYWVFLKLIFHTIFPKLASKFKMTLISKKITGFFQDVIKETLRERQEKKIIRPDMIHIMMEAAVPPINVINRNNEENNVDNNHISSINVDDIAAQGFLFFIAGFEAVSMLMAFSCHELAVNSNIQIKLQEEIDLVFEKNEKLDYETMVKMKYLDMVISEVLRKWSPGGIINRECVCDYKIPASEIHGEDEITIKKGIGIIIPTFGLHRDPKFYPNPERFDPERFNDQNKHNINPYAYLPFGIGPRNCIGSRLALLETKVLIIYLLRKFELTVVGKTEIPLKLSPKNPFLGPDGFWLGLKKRK